LAYPCEYCADVAKYTPRPYEVPLIAKSLVEMALKGELGELITDLL